MEYTELVELGYRVEAIVVLNLLSREAIKAGEEQHTLLYPLPRRIYFVKLILPTLIIVLVKNTVD
ncbi:MAG: hypothetical protein QXM55_06145 [Ignisphaera sp.]